MPGIITPNLPFALATEAEDRIDSTLDSSLCDGTPYYLLHWFEKVFLRLSGEEFSALDLPASITVHSEKTPFSAMMQGLAIHPAAMRGCSQEQRFSG
jgi:hypothetical protein